MFVKNIQIYSVQIVGKCIFKSKNCKWIFLLSQAKLSLSQGRLKYREDSCNTQFLLDTIYKTLKKLNKILNKNCSNFS